MEEITTNYEKIKWTDAPGYPEGSKIKILREGGYGEGKTFLRKIKRGFKMEGHSHTTVEQHFVLEGEYESEGKVYKTGTYRLIPKHETHGPFTSSKGAVILVIWDLEKEIRPGDFEEMKKDIEKFSREEKVRFLQNVVPVICKDLAEDDECVDMLKEAFGETVVREMMRRSEMAII
jgi:quercetin dioxygenase-like cupin family protein